MQTVREIASDIISREGGFVNDPDDPGGATKYGVTLKTLKRLGLDVTGDNSVDIQDVTALTREQAVEIYLRHYYDAPRIGTLPRGVQASVFDMYVNAGANAVRILQRLLNDMGYSVRVDGVIGPETAAVTQEAHDIAPRAFVDAYGIARRNYYYALADARPASRKFARRRDGGKGGWIKRAEEFITREFHLSEREHHERVAAWG
ncbi:MULTISPECIES: holin-associated N-acetylmuramidase [Halocynthiibacter]|uniref:Holin-associated N-acetylmuramidase n=1 Tax=Halocynthiibacter halioticoli TaxID=2986804 RepID=A0AAE3IZW7_9RHOB|nr:MULTISPECIES: holin-associated N-acetylmuramidase [Halocynthiibacter]MCV6824165.1 holin-associated N-acetylmuramidase [Halocynthiibacter halioticoli]MCW4057166.1 holin-associated N-acetylmuramidase [Halocynthiibacter sp. SDUM655004]